MQKLLGIFGALALAFGLTGAPAGRTALAQNVSNELHFTPWQKHCLSKAKTAGNSICMTWRAVYRTNKEAPAKRTFVAVAALIEKPKSEQKILRFLVPLGMQLVHGTRVIIDDDKPLQESYVGCGALGCVTDYHADVVMQRRLSGAGKLTVQAINAYGSPVSIPLSLEGYSKAQEGPEVDFGALTNRQQTYLRELANAGLVGVNFRVGSLTRSPWTKLCQKERDVKAKTVCFTGMDMRAQSGLPAIAAVLIEPENEAKKIWRVTVPVGVKLSSRLRIAIDRTLEQTAPFVICFKNGCMADFEATRELQSVLRAGHALLVHVTDGADRAADFSLPLQGFAKANDGLPAGLKNFAAQQRKLQKKSRR